MKWVILKAYLVQTLAVHKLAKNSQKLKQTRVRYNDYFSKKTSLLIFKSIQAYHSRILIHARRQRHIWMENDMLHFMYFYFLPVSFPVKSSCRKTRPQNNGLFLRFPNHKLLPPKHSILPTGSKKKKKKKSKHKEARQRKSERKWKQKPKVSIWTSLTQTIRDFSKI